MIQISVIFHGMFLRETMIIMATLRENWPTPSIQVVGSTLIYGEDFVNGKNETFSCNSNV